jgi:predicted lipoprotein with Yx(FWY)xxD motif
MKRYLPTAAVLLASAAVLPAEAQDSGTALEIRQSAKYGQYLVDGDGRSLYLFTADRQGQGSEAARSTCYDACATAWPPLTAKSVPEARGAVDQGLLSTIERGGGETQVTHNGWPLYYWVGDKGQGQATGQDVKQFGGEWYLVTPSGHEAHAQASIAPGGERPLQAAVADMAFKGPECVRYHAAQSQYLVSNINGGMRAADDNGFISRLRTDGSGELKWIAAGANGVTLNAPKGMAIADGRLHVADIDHLRTFDAKTGDPVSSLEIEGAKFLNDVAIASDGTVYITDSGTKDVPGAIYEVTADRKVRTIAEGRDLDRPNGIDFDRDGNLVWSRSAPTRCSRFRARARCSTAGTAGRADRA